MNYYNRYRLITFIYILLLLIVVEVSIYVFDVNAIYLQIIIIFPFVLLFQRPYLRVLKTMEERVMKKFESSCLIEDIADYHDFLGKRYNRIFIKQRKYKTLYYFYLTTFYTSNHEFKYTEDLLDFLNGNLKYNISKIQVLNNEMLKEAIKGNFEKVEDLYIELSYSVDIEISKHKEGSRKIALLNQIKIVLGKFVELTKNVNEETISNARLWVNNNKNLYNAIDNYCIVKILEHHNNLEYIEEFKENLRNIDGDIVFLQ